MRVSEVHYFFSVSRTNRRAPLWRNGTVYVLPRGGFTRQEPERIGRHLIEEPHWASTASVRPVARISVAPSDFPFPDKVREHDAAEIDAKLTLDPYGYPRL